MIQGQWELRDNSAYEGRKPTILEARCHDRSPFLTVTCGYCGSPNHVHETQFAYAPIDAEVALRCSGCRIIQLSMVSFFVGAFSKMRRDGWIE